MTMEPVPTSMSTSTPAEETRWEKWLFRMQFTLSLAITLGVLAYISWLPHRTAHEIEVRQSQPMQVVHAVGHGIVWVEPESLLSMKLQLLTVEPHEVSTPQLRVTGTVVASLRPIGENNGDQWQFHNPDVLASFHEWRRSQVDVAFAVEQVDRMRALSEARIEAKRKIIERLERLVAAGTDTIADLETARAELLELEIEGRKDVHEAETELRRALRSEAVLIRQLQLVGLDPEMLLEATKEVDIVVADVPEEFHARVHVGMQCEARFFGLPREIFSGVVRSIAPVLSAERRSLQVLFFVDDPDDRLRPGMFADIGLGTELRQAMLIPDASIIHIGREDYVFVQSPVADSHWQVTRVDVGDTYLGRTEIFAGLQPGDRIVTEGAILLKPVAATSLLLNHDPTVLDASEPLSSVQGAGSSR